MTVAVTGIRELDIKFENMKRSLQRKIVKKAMTQGTKEVTKAIKRMLPSSWKGAKKTIGQRVNRPGRGSFKGVTFAKAGAGVGMKKKRRAAMSAKAKEKGRGQRSGVGIGVSNIMWFLDGTSDRYTGTKRLNRRSSQRVDTGNSKRYTGKMQKSGIVKSAYRASAHTANQLIMAQIKVGIMAEAKKR